uniref:Switch-associated protein 70-like n=1 Tax=Nicotiana sylvestris TaxID=4096 RepID=A0A1U7XZ31_NICSY|nr:PREDICTED: switch-associated protein 70-like [Nicotiana sylvestris]
MSADEILATVLGERTGYVRGKGYGKKPTKKSSLQQVDLEASMSSQMERMRQEMQEEMDKKLQEERKQMAVELKSKLEEEMAVELQSKLEEQMVVERARTDLQLEKRIEEKMDAWLIRMQQQGQDTSRMRK